MTFSRARTLAAFAALTVATAALAGPPYETDDPVPTDPGKWEVFAFNEGEHVPHAFALESGLDINYGAAEDLQVTTVLPFLYEHEEGHGRSGIGDIEFGAKYRFIHQSEGSWVPEVSFYPTMTLPTGGHFSSGKVGAFLPLWAEKDIGDWSMFGGGGYAINPGEGNKDFWVLGYALTRQVSEKLNLGAEVEFETAEEIGGGDRTHLGVGASYEIADHWALLASGGPDLGPGAEHGQYSFYLGLEFSN